MDETERERWRGAVAADLKTMHENVKTLFKLNRDCENDRQRLELLITALTGNVNTLAMKIGLISGIGALLGAATMQYVLSLFRH